MNLYIYIYVFMHVFVSSVTSWPLLFAAIAHPLVLALQSSPLLAGSKGSSEVDLERGLRSSITTIHHVVYL